MSNKDDVVMYVLKHAKELPADKISALANVIKAIGEEVEVAPNTLSEKEDQNLIDEVGPIDFSNINTVEIDGKKTPVKIVRS